MKESLGFIVLFAVLGTFGLWQMNRANKLEAEGVRKQAMLDAQAETIDKLEAIGKKIDEALGEWRKEGAAIQRERQETRRNTTEAARKDPTLREQLDTPLHPALRRGGGLLGGMRPRQNGTVPGSAGGAFATDPGP